MCFTLSNIAKSCDNNVGGARKIYFCPLDEFAVTSADTTSSSIITATISTALYSIDVPPNSLSYNVTLNDNSLGITEYSHTVNFILPYRNATTNYKLRAYIEAQPDLVAIVLTNNGEYKVLGKDNGLNVRSNDGGTGVSKQELNGYTITLEGIEKEMEYDIPFDQISAFI